MRFAGLQAPLSLPGAVTSSSHAAQAARSATRAVACCFAGRHGARHAERGCARARPFLGFFPHTQPTATWSASARDFHRAPSHLVKACVASSLARRSVPCAGCVRGRWWSGESLSCVRTSKNARKTGTVVLPKLVCVPVVIRIQSSKGPNGAWPDDVKWRRAMAMRSVTSG